MTYIRTKDTIYEVLEEDDVCYTVRAKHDQNKIYKKSKIQTRVISQSDLLSGLVNRYIITKDKRSYKIYTKSQFESLSRTEILSRLRAGYRILGCIWTDKGLDWVMEMNEEGELCLL